MTDEWAEDGWDTFSLETKLQNIDIEKIQQEYQKLNEEQKRIIIELKHNKLIMLQAGPGTGKTFTMNYLTGYMLSKHQPATIVIFKHDLLKLFKGRADTSTVASFYMKRLHLENFYKWCALCRYLSGNLSVKEHFFILAKLIQLLNQQSMPKLLILDEWTCVLTPLILATICICEMQSTQLILCGDKNQLQAISNSPLDLDKDKFDSLAKRMKLVHLYNNMRCTDNRHNQLLNYIIQFSSYNKKLVDDYIVALIVSLYFKNTFTVADYQDDHLAATHRELTDLLHHYVMNENYPVDFYYIDGTNARTPVFGELIARNLYKPMPLVDYMNSQKVDKFLPYVPLVVGASYYVEGLQEENLYILQQLDLIGGTLKLVQGSTSKMIGRTSFNETNFFSEHYKYLKGAGGGRLYGFAIYPANIMSFHMAQGRTVAHKVHLDFRQATYRGLYVGMSRITDPNNMRQLTFNNLPSHLFSIIINFPQLCDANYTLTVEESVSTLDGSYIHYLLEIEKYFCLPDIMKFFTSTQFNERTAIRCQLLQHISSMKAQRLFKPKLDELGSDKLNVELFLPHLNNIKSASKMFGLDSILWLNEYIRSCPDLNVYQSSAREAASNNFNEIANILHMEKYENKNETSIQLIERHAKLQNVSVCEPKTVIDRVNDDLVKVSTHFAASLYRKYKTGNNVDTQWLLDQLKAYTFKEINSGTPQKLKFKRRDPGKRGINGPPNKNHKANS